MHAVVMDSLEDYLSGTLNPADERAIEAHLNACSMCREEVRGMRDLSQFFGSLRSEEAVEPSGSFFARVIAQVEEQKAAPAFAGAFALDFGFARRLIFASLLTLAVVGSYLAAREAQAYGPSPEAVMAQENSPNLDSASAQDNMLVTLTAYERH